MSGKGDRKQVFKFLFANEEEKTQLKEIMSRGVDVFYQEIPDVGRKDLAKILK
jgi:mannose/fructose/N-acetylgalactosamine-specific phosphotransferase system component IIB